MEINKKLNIQGIDINKEKKPLLPESLGISLLVPLWVFIILNSLVNFSMQLIFVGLMISTFTFLGFIDDLKPKFRAKQFDFKLRAILSIIAALIFAFLLQPNNLFFAAILILLTTSFQNSFAGLNGLEVGSGFILSILLLFFVPMNDLVLIIIISIFALLLFNAFPAKVFPGDSGTFFIGSAIAAILLTQSNNAMLFLLFYLPHFIDLFLKISSNINDISQSKTKPYALKDNLICIPENNKTIDFAKLIIKISGPKKESTLTLILWLIVFFNALFWLWFFKFI